MEEDGNEVILLSVGFYSEERMIFCFFSSPGALLTKHKTTRHSNSNYCFDTAGEREDEDVIVQKARQWEGK